MFADLGRPRLVRSALILQWVTIVWMLLEAGLAVRAALLAHSVSLMGFGMDSIVELLSAAVVARRLYVELRDGQTFNENVEKRAAFLAGILLFVVAIYVIASAVLSLIHRSGQEESLLGLVVTAFAVVFMPWLGARKRQLAAKLDSRALRADGAEAVACAYLSLAVLIGLVAQYVTHWWWIDSVTSLAVVYFLVREGREALTGDDCCDDS